MASSLVPHLSREDIEEELDFTDVLIQSLDEGADDYHQRFAELEETKRTLEARLETLLNGESGHQSAEASGSAIAAEEMDIFRAQEMNMFRPEPASGRYTPQNGISSMDGSLDPGYAGMKRPATDTLRLEAGSGHPSKRPTPEPSNAPTPASSVTSLNDSDSSSERARRRQLAAEAAYRRQRLAQQEDERMARQLSQAQTTTPSASSSFSQKPTVQTTLLHNGSYQRPPPPPPLEPPSHSSAQSYGMPSTNAAYNHYLSRTLPTPNSVGRTQPPYIKPESGHSMPPHIKPEASYATPSQSVQPRRPIANVIDLTASDDEEDEELTEIDRTRYTPNNRAPRPGPSFGSPLAVRSTQQFPFLHGMQMPGAWPTGRQNGYQSVYGNADASGVQNGAYHGPPRSMMDRARIAANGIINGANYLINGNGSNGPPPLFDPYGGDDDLYRRRYNDIADNNPEKTREEINALLENIRPDEEIPEHLRIHTPEAMSIKLHKYQELGLTWLKNCEEGSNKGGILADEMGLGKTIQMLGLVVTRKSDNPLCKTTLIVAPVALMRQWKQEIEQKIKPGRHRLTVFIQHGQNKKKSFHDLRMFDIVLTTYGTLGAEVKKLEAFKLRQKGDPTARMNKAEQCALLGEDANWYRVILDEAQCIKNRTTRTAQAACLVNAKYRFCMTGTPMMNNVAELYSLIKFLRIQPYCRWEKFRLDIGNAVDAKKDPETGEFKAAMSRLQTLCKAVMMRRTKKSTFEGEPILVLPDIVREDEHPEFEQDEWDFYHAVEGKMKLEFNRYVKRGDVGRNYTAILVLLLRLRQAACHPHLLKDFSIAGAADITEEEVVNFAKSLDPQVVARIKATGGNFECPVCYDVVENPAIFIPCGHDACRECFSRITDPSLAIRDGNENGNGETRCMNCRTPIDPKKVTDFDAFKKVHMRELLTEEEREELERKENGGDDEGSATASDDEEDSEDSDDEDEIDAKGNLADFVVNDDVDEDSETDIEEGAAGPSKKPQGKKKKPKAKKSKGKKPKKNKTKAHRKEVTLADLAKLSHRNIKARKSYLRRLRDRYQDSAKIRKTMELLQRIMAAPEGEKVLVFSQWTSLLDLVEIPIDGQGWDYRRYDGSMNAKMRADAVDDFRDHRKNVRIMLVSLKAGNAGLNLTSASQVIILDPFWNPYIEEQAIDRTHRIGQEREVQVHRMLIEGTIEDRIIAIQENKRALINAALDEKQSQSISRLGIQELAYLFGITANPNERVEYRPR